MWVIWLTIGLVLWSAVALALAVLVGRGIRVADLRATRPRISETVVEPDPTTESLAGVTDAGTAARGERRWVGLTGIGVALAAVAVALQTSGYVARLLDVSGTAGRLLSMDGPVGVPRFYVTALFAAAAMVAAVGAGRFPERRAWWSSVAVVAAMVAAVKGGVVHGAMFRGLSRAVTFEGALLASALIAAIAVGGLWWVSRAERRDRARVLGALTLYAVASIGLSGVSLAVLGASGAGSTWAISATFLEESGEALAAVAFLAAVLVGVAPQLALPAHWALRRSSDEGFAADAIAPPASRRAGGSAGPFV